MTALAMNIPLRDAMYELSLVQNVPDPALLDDFVRRYPEHARELTDFAIELALGSLAYDIEDCDIPEDAEATSDAVSRAMSEFQNNLFKKRRGPVSEPPARAATQPIKNPFAALDRTGFRALVTRLDVSVVFLSKLRDRGIEPDTIPPPYRRFLADEMEEPTDILDAHLFAPPQTTEARQFHKAEGKPSVIARQSFEEAVRSSALTEAQQQRLLSFREG